MNIITFIENCGVQIELDGVVIWVDPYCSPIFTLWKKTPDRIREDMLAIRPPFKRPDILLITHVHSDHYSYEFTSELLRSSSSTKLLAPSTVHADLLKHGFKCDNGQIIGTCDLKTELTSRDGKTVGIECVETEHSDGGVFATEHFSFIIRGSSTILIAGDADLRKGYFAEKEAGKKVDIVIASFTCIAQKKIRKSIQEIFSPEMVIIVHLPDPEHDEFHYLEAVEMAEERVRKEGGSVTIMRNNYESYEWE